MATPSSYSPFVDAAIKSKGQVEYHKVHKRQAGRRCLGTFLDQQCTNGLAQERADLAFRCGQSQEAQDLLKVCQQNPMGVYCGIAASHKITGEEIAILFACRGSNCTPQCRNLLMNIRNELGCCLNMILNFSSEHYTPYPPAFTMGILWS